MAFKLDTSDGSRRIGTNLAEINIIPLVDVVLVLLLIFMLTAPMMYRGIDVNLPRAAAKPTAGGGDAAQQDALPQGGRGPQLRRGHRDDGPGAARRDRAPRHGDRARAGALIIATASAVLRPRGRLHLGPALARLHLPLGSVLLSATCHVLAFGALFYAAHLWREHQPRTYVVNLVPAVAAVGAPPGPPPPPARPEDLRPPAPTPTELPRRETSRETTTRPGAGV